MKLTFENTRFAVTLENSPILCALVATQEDGEALAAHMAEMFPGRRFPVKPSETVTTYYSAPGGFYCDSLQAYATTGNGAKSRRPVSWHAYRAPPR